jgi:hypothetical protein
LRRPPPIRWQSTYRSLAASRVQHSRIQPLGPYAALPHPSTQMSRRSRATAGLSQLVYHLLGMRSLVERAEVLHQGVSAWPVDLVHQQAVAPSGKMVEDPFDSVALIHCEDARELRLSRVQRAA